MVIMGVHLPSVMEAFFYQNHKDVMAHNISFPFFQVRLGVPALCVKEHPRRFLLPAATASCTHLSGFLAGQFFSGRSFLVPAASRCRRRPHRAR